MSTNYCILMAVLSLTKDYAGKASRWWFNVKCIWAYVKTLRLLCQPNDNCFVLRRPNFISTDMIANMQGDKAALLAEVQARMVANPEMAKGIGLEPIDPADPDLHQPVLAPGVCPMGNFNGQAPPLSRGRRTGSGGCPMGHWSQYQLWHVVGCFVINDDVQRYTSGDLLGLNHADFCSGKQPRLDLSSNVSWGNSGCDKASVYSTIVM